MLRFSTKDANGMLWRVFKMYAIFCVSVLFLFHFAKMYLTVKCMSVLHASMYVHCVCVCLVLQRSEEGVRSLLELALQVI